jgi:hypothetical protein
MSAVNDVASWANDLVRREMRGPGDMEGAMHRLESRFGIPWRTFWELRYRKPADVMTGLYRQMYAAYQSECERQERLLRHEREIAKAKAEAFAASIGSPSELAGHEGD